MSFSGPVGPSTPYPAQPGHPGPPPGPEAVPSPPPGPGVSPPFAAPPVEGRSRRLWLGLGVAGLAVLLCCGGGAAGLVGLAVTGMQAQSEQARAVVGDYLGALKDKQYDRAYGLLCDAEQQRESPAEFEQRASTEPEITSYTVGRAERTQPVRVPVELVYAGGDRDSRRVTLAQDTGNGRLEVCGIR